MENPNRPCSSFATSVTFVVGTTADDFKKKVEQKGSKVVRARRPWKILKLGADDDDSASSGTIGMKNVFLLL